MNTQERPGLSQTFLLTFTFAIHLLLLAKTGFLVAFIFLLKSFLLSFSTSCPRNTHFRCFFVGDGFSDPLEQKKKKEEEEGVKEFGETEREIREDVGRGYLNNNTKDKSCF